MTEVNAMVLRAAGINCDTETNYALELAGAEAQRVHINRLIEDKTLLDKFHILVFPGGFSYGDDVAAGKILANQVIHHLAKPVRKFIDDGKLVLGICNGFQVLVKAGVLPGKTTDDTNSKMNDITITCNDSGKFEDRWVYLAPQTKKCIFIEPDRQIYLPVAHGEGKFVTKDNETLQKLIDDNYIAFKYVDENGDEGDYPVNPNGSVASIAGITDKTGRVLGLMPHPERYIHPTHHPNWTRHEPPAATGAEHGGRTMNNKQRTPDGMTIFKNAVKYIQQNF